MLGAASFNWLSRIRGSLGLTQAALVLLSSLLVGLALSAMQLRYHLVLERTTATDLLSDVLTSADGGATNAAWTLDPRLAEDVVANVMAIRGIWLAEIRDEHGAVLARAAKPDEPRGELITWLTRTFIGDEFRDQRTLSVVDQG